MSTRFKRKPGLSRQKEQSTGADLRKPREGSGVPGMAGLARPGLRRLIGANEKWNWAKQLEQRTPRDRE